MVKTRHGEAGAPARTRVEDCGSATAAEAYVADAVREKEREGYVPVGTGHPRRSKAVPPTPRRQPTRTPSPCPRPGGRASDRAGAAAPPVPLRPPRVGPRLLGPSARDGRTGGVDRSEPRRGRRRHRPGARGRRTPLSGGGGGSGRRRGRGRRHRPPEADVRVRRRRLDPPARPGLRGPCHGRAVRDPPRGPDPRPDHATGRPARGRSEVPAVAAPGRRRPGADAAVHGRRGHVPRGGGRPGRAPWRCAAPHRGLVPGADRDRLGRGVLRPTRGRAAGRTASYAPCCSSR